MPFRCKAYAVKPRSAVSTTIMDSRAWVGVNLGLSTQSPGAYIVFVPGFRVVVTSDVYFDETCFSWSSSPAIAVSAAGVPPQPATRIQTPDLPNAGDTSSPHNLRTADHVVGSAAHSKRALLLSSGPVHRPDGIAAFLKDYGLDCDSLDNHRAYGGGDSCGSIFPFVTVSGVNSGAVATSRSA
eukprot:3439380-Pleurochrysis_carterae.AAC.1